MNDNNLKETQVVGNQGLFEENHEWSEEMYIPANDVVDIVYTDDGIMTRGQATFNWSVPVGTRYVTKAFYFTKDTVIQIACTATPASSTYWFGIMNENSNCYIVEGSGSGNHDFTVPSTGYYRVMVENRSNQVLNVAGSYTY